MSIRQIIFYIQAKECEKVRKRNRRRVGGIDAELIGWVGGVDMMCCCDRMQSFNWIQLNSIAEHLDFYHTDV